MEIIYKLNDRVYNGTIELWGTIVQINDNADIDYPIRVDFDNGLYEMYTLDGRKYIDSIPVLSFTEYDFVNGGFSQIKPIILPKIELNQLVYIRLPGDREWYMRYFSHFDKNGELWFFSGQFTSKETKSIREAHEYSIENPLI